MVSLSGNRKYKTSDTPAGRLRVLTERQERNLVRNFSTTPGLSIHFVINNQNQRPRDLSAERPSEDQARDRSFTKEQRQGGQVCSGSS